MAKATYSQMLGQILQSRVDDDIKCARFLKSKDPETIVPVKRDVINSKITCNDISPDLK